MLNNYQHTGGKMNIHQLRKLCPREEVDYQTLLSFLKDYKYPRNKIKIWLNSGDLIRIKKGLYIFGPNAALQTYSPQLLANLIYGPSALSLMSALSYYGIIPEKVVIQTSITPNRDKIFETSVGTFTYKYLNIAKYSIGITQRNLDAHHTFLIASPEKALVDQLYLIDKNLSLKTLNDIEHYIVDDLRCDEEELDKFDLTKLHALANVYKHPHIFLLHKYFQKRKQL
jgi:predicted transcriptional regulator of viral defense system